MRDLAGKLLRYLVTGGLAAVVDAGGFALLIHWPMSIAIAATISFGAAVIVNYLLTSRFVFASGTSLRGFGLFVSAALLGLAVNVGVTVLVSAHAGVPPVVAKIIGIGTAFLINFALNVRVVYRKKHG